MEGSIVLPKLIQGGMGVAISDWRLAKAVSQLGQLGVVAGTAFALCDESAVLRPRLFCAVLSRGKMARWAIALPLSRWVIM